MKIGDLVKVIYESTTGIVAKITPLFDGADPPDVRITLHTGNEFPAHKLEVINENR
jgi:hypothetical protein